MPMRPRRFSFSSAKIAASASGSSVRSCDASAASFSAAQYGPVLKVSEDGLITFYDHQERIWDI